MKEKIEINSESKTEFFRKPEAERVAEKIYSNELPYHNFSHAEEAVENGRIIVQNCRKENLPVDEKVVYYANLFHDGGFHENHKERGFSSKEEYSAHLAGQALKALGEDNEIISQVQSAIWATHRDKKFVTNEEKAVRASDLAEMAKDYETFLGNAMKLKLETEMMSGQNISWEEWKNRVKKLVEFYLSQDIHLTSAHDDENGDSVWHKKVKENLERFLKEEEKATKKEAI